MVTALQTRDVFINCPFDSLYKSLFEAVVFCVLDCGFRARCSLEAEDSAQVRIEKLFQIIAECRYGIHDISRTDLDRDTRLPRFNMPFELGVFVAAKRFGGKEQRQKACLILDAERYRYQRFLSDISGQDIQAHNNEPREAIRVVRNWLRVCSGNKLLPGGAEVFRRYQHFLEDLPDLCSEARLQVDEMTFSDFTAVATSWIEDET